MSKGIEKKKFAIEYASSPEKSIRYWAKRYKKSERTIRRWLRDREVQEIIAGEIEDYKKEIEERLKRYAVEAIEELRKIMKSKKISEVKRKACNDILGLLRIENVNVEGKSEVKVKIDYKRLSIEELIKIYEERIRR